jgi:hypothetical protein
MAQLKLLAVTLVTVGLFVTVPLVQGQLAATVTLVAQQQETQKPPAGESTPEVQAAEMIGRHQKMMANMKAMDAKLNELVAKMNSATGEAKVDAIAELLTTIVQQHQSMRGGMMQMQGQMMNQMQDHMRRMGPGK